MNPPDSRERDRAEFALGALLAVIAYLLAWQTWQ
jgi:hypothetical protein